jgi:hypothetical protein
MCLVLRMQYHIRPATMASAATPPTTPPTMAPMGAPLPPPPPPPEVVLVELELEDELDEVDDELLDAGLVDVVVTRGPLQDVKARPTCPV